MNLQGLQQIDWAKLQHAYGPATDVPILLQQVASGDQAQRNNAFYKLYGNVFHQGSRYSASPHVIPFLWQMIADPQHPAWVRCVRFAVDLLLGFPEAHYGKGLQTDHFYWKESLHKELLNEYEKGAPLLRELLAKTDSYYWPWIAYALTWMPSGREQNMALLLQAWGEGRYPLDRAQILLSLSYLGGLPEASGEESEWESLFRELAQMRIKHDATALNMVLKYVELGSDWNYHADSVVWSGGSLQKLFFVLLKEVRSRSVPINVINSMMKGFTRSIGTLSFAFAEALVSLAFPQPLESSPTFEHLTREQQSLLRELARHYGPWRVGNFCAQLISKGLPGTQGALIQYIGDSGLSIDPFREREAMGDLLYTEFRYVEAAKEYETALNMPEASGSPKRAAELRRRRAVILLNMGKIEDALGDLQKARTLDPSSSRIATELGLVFDKMNRVQEAETSFAEALRLEPTNVNLVGNLCYVSRRLGKWNDVVEWGKKALSMKPDFYDMETNISTALIQLGRFDECAGRLEAVAKLIPQVEWVWYNLACCYARAGKHSESIRALKRAIELRPESVQDAIADEDLMSLRGLPEFQQICGGNG